MAKQIKTAKKKKQGKGNSIESVTTLDSSEMHEGFSDLEVELSRPITMEHNDKPGIFSAMGQLASENKLLALAIVSAGGFGIYSLLNGKEEENGQQAPPKTANLRRRPQAKISTISDTYEDALLGIDEPDIDDEAFEEMLFSSDDGGKPGLKPEFQPLRFG